MEQNKNLFYDDPQDVSGRYLHEISQAPLLNAEQEIDLAKRIEAGLFAKQLLEEQNEREETSEELLIIAEQGKAAEDLLIVSNLPLVVSIAKKYTQWRSNESTLQLCDVISEGNFGLIHAAKTFDYKKGFKFSTHAYLWIKQAILRGINYQMSDVYLPERRKTEINQARTNLNKLSSKLGHPATAGKLAMTMGEQPQKITWLLQLDKLPLSLDQTLSSHQDSSLGQILQDDQTSPEEVVIDKLEFENLYNKLAKLPSNEQEIIKLRFGFGAREKQSRRAVAMQLGRTITSVRALETRGLKKLREDLKDLDLTG